MSPDTPDHASTPVAEVVDAQVRFRVRVGRRDGWLHAVDGVSLAVAPGETVALVGESGSGKSTLGRLFLGLQAPTRGQVRYDGADLRTLRGLRWRAFRRAVQVVFQDTGSSLNPRRSILSTVEMPLRHNLRLPRGEARRRAAELLDRVGLPAASFATRGPLDLSGGQRQRVAIARAMASEPRLIVADEAVSALDVSVRAQVLQVMRDLQQASGVSYLFITHDLGVVGAVADRVVVMYLGEIVEEGPTAQVVHSPAHPYTRALLDAAPKPDPRDRSLLRPRLRGEIPSPVDPPPGCRFHTRCPLALPICATTPPAASRLPGGGVARCHRAEEVRGGLVDEVRQA